MAIFPQSSLKPAWLKRAPVQAIAIACFILLLGVASLVVPGRDIETHAVLHHLNFLPLMLAGMLFGWRGAAVASLFGALIDAPVIAHYWRIWPLDAKDQILEFSIFSAAGLIAGYLSDRERAQRRKVERTQRELQTVYTTLRENIASMKKAERLSAAGRLAASLAHEIRNPLASISGAAGILRRGTASMEYKNDCLDIIDKESQRLNKLLTGFLNFAKPRLPRLQRTDPNAILASVASLALHAAEASRISVLHETLSSCPEIECDPEQLKQVLLNLLINAIEASPLNATIWIRTAVQNDVLAMEVQDQGSGISEEYLDHIFDPFFTTKPKGTGLGLAISSMIVAQHGGSLSFRRNPDCGATFRIELPLFQEIADG
jgi:signal transduction histidine kinase